MRVVCLVCSREYVCKSKFQVEEKVKKEPEEEEGCGRADGDDDDKDNDDGYDSNHGNIGSGQEMWDVFCSSFLLNSTKWQGIHKFYEKVKVFPVCPSCLPQFSQLLSLQQEFERIFGELQKVKAQVCHTIVKSSLDELPPSPSNFKQVLDENDSYYPTLADGEFNERVNSQVHRWRRHLTNRFNPQVALKDCQRKSSKNSPKDCLDNLIIANTVSLRDVDQSCYINSDSSNVNVVKVEVKAEDDLLFETEYVGAEEDEEEEIVVGAEWSPAVTPHESQYGYGGGDNLDPLESISSRENNAGVFHYGQWSYVQLENETCFQCLKCKWIDETHDSMISHIYSQHENPQSQYQSGFSNSMTMTQFASSSSTYNSKSQTNRSTRSSHLNSSSHGNANGKTASGSGSSSSSSSSHGSKLWCKQCKLPFYSKASMRRHERKYHLPQPVKAPHLPRKTGRILHNCPYCPSSYLVKKSLKSHVLKNHEGHPLPDYFIQEDNAFA